jgi:hypothetical protein
VVPVTASGAASWHRSRSRPDPGRSLKWGGVRIERIVRGLDLAGESLVPLRRGCSPAGLAAALLATLLVTPIWLLCAWPPAPLVVLLPVLLTVAYHLAERRARGPSSRPVVARQDLPASE